MGHYREGRPQPWEDRMKGVEVCYTTVKKINNSPFTGFSVWEKGKHIIPPSRRHWLRQVKNMALNRGYKPRLGMPMDEDANHTRMVKAMVSRILLQNNPWQRRRNVHNVDMHPAFLRRPLKRPPPRPTAKLKPEWRKSTLTHGRHTPFLTAEQRYTRFKNRIRCPDIPVRRFRDVPVHIRQGTPFSMTPKPKTKLIDATHGLPNRRLFDFRKSPSKSQKFTDDPKDFMTRIGSDDEGMVKTYSNVLNTPDAISFYTPCPYVKKKKMDVGYHRYWFYDMDNKDLPCDLKITPSDHAMDNPIRPASSQRIDLDPFTEPMVLYDDNFRPLAHAPSIMSSPSSFGMHAYGSRPGWAPPGPTGFLDREYREYEAMSSPGGSISGASSPRSMYNEATQPMTPIPPWTSGTSSPFFSYDPSASRNLAPNWISPFYSFDKANFRNDEGGVSRPQSTKRPNSREELPSSANPEAGTLGSEMGGRFGGLVRSLPSSPGYLTPRSNIFKPVLVGEDVNWTVPEYQKHPYKPADDPPWKRMECCENP